jgi:hypothetical protein
MMNETQISPEAHAAAKRPITVVTKGGKLSYMVYGVLEVSTLDEAVGMLEERRSEPREVQLMPPPVDVAAMNAKAGYDLIDRRGPVEPFVK